MLGLLVFTDTIFVLILSKPFSHLIKIEKSALRHNEANYQSNLASKLTQSENLNGTTKKIDVNTT